jgi:hypothetical protein
VEEAVKQRLRFEETVNEVQARNLLYSEAEMMADIEEAIQETRKTHHVHNLMSCGAC